MNFIKDGAHGEHRAIVLESALVCARQIVKLDNLAVLTLQFISVVSESVNGRRRHQKHRDFELIRHAQVDDLRRGHYQRGRFFIQCKEKECLLGIFL